MKLDYITRLGFSRQIYIDDCSYNIEQKAYNWVSRNHYSALFIDSEIIHIIESIERYNSLRMYYEI